MPETCHIQGNLINMHKQKAWTKDRVEIEQAIYVYAKTKLKINETIVTMRSRGRIRKPDTLCYY